MRQTLLGVLSVVATAALIVVVDVVFLRDHFWVRLMVNVGVVLVFMAVYFRFVRHA